MNYIYLKGPIPRFFLHLGMLFIDGLVYLYIHSVTYVTLDPSVTEYNYNKLHFIYCNITYYIWHPSYIT